MIQHPGTRHLEIHVLLLLRIVCARWAQGFGGDSPEQRKFIHKLRLGTKAYDGEDKNRNILDIDEDVNMNGILDRYSACSTTITKH